MTTITKETFLELLARRFPRHYAAYQGKSVQALKFLLQRGFEACGVALDPRVALIWLQSDVGWMVFDFNQTASASLFPSDEP